MNSLPKKQKGKTWNVWYCVLMNQLAFPGMGTIMGGRRVGYFQAALMIAGFALVMGFMFWFFTCTIRFLSGAPWNEEEFAAKFQPYGWMWKTGLALCAVAWFLSLLSSLALLRRAKEAAHNRSPGPEQEQASSSSPPPPLPPAANAEH